MESFPSILMKTKNWQNTYGVKRGNFKAYKKFANRRSKKIRKNLGVTFGKKFDKKKYNNNFINPQLIKEYDPDRIYLLVESLLLVVEKNYIFYQESKSQTSTLKKAIVKKKLRKALKITQEIQQYYGEYLNQRVNLELKVYQSMINAALNIEQKNFVKAKENCLFLIAVLKELSDLLSVIERAQIEEMIQQAQIQLRYCKFQLKEFDMNEESIPILGKEDIKGMLNQIQMENQKQIGNKCKIMVFNKEIEIDDPKIVEVIEKVFALGKTYQNIQDRQQREDLFWEIQNEYEDGIKICHQYKIDSGNNSSLVKIWDSIEDYFMCNKTLNLMIRSVNVFQNLQSKQQKAKPQEFIKICEIILGHFRGLNDLQGKYSQSTKFINFFENIFRTTKIYNISLLYYQSKLYKQTLSLIQMSKQHLNSFEELMKNSKIEIENQIKDFEKRSNLMTGQILNLYQQMNSIYDQLRLKIITLGKQGKIALYDEQQSNMDNIQKELEDLNVKEQFDKGENVNSLMDLVLEDYPSRGDDLMDFIKIPPISELIPTNPINFDIASDFIVYQELKYDDLEPQQKKGGFFSKIFGK